jgi:hypothetical protein
MKANAAGQNVAQAVEDGFCSLGNRQELGLLDGIDRTLRFEAEKSLVQIRPYPTMLISTARIWMNFENAAEIVQRRS